MTRDMELVREILLRFEERDYPQSITTDDFPGRDPRQVVEHCITMNRAGLLEQYSVSNDEGDLGDARISWAGYDFLDAARNDTVWRRVWHPIRDAGQSVPLEVMKALLIEATRRWGMEAVFGAGGGSSAV